MTTNNDTDQTPPTEPTTAPVVIGCSDLLACPFCDGDPADLIIEHCEEDCCGATPRMVACPCGVELNGTWPNDEAIINAWNSRVRESSIKRAMHDAIRRPMGVVPASAERFYNQSYYSS